MHALRKSSVREIRKSLGRYLAILAIVALGVGFFCGLRVCRDAMVKTGDDYLNRQNMYDYRLVSTLGFSTDDEAVFASLEGVAAAEGSISKDALAESEELEFSGVLYFHALTEEVNAFSLTAGRLPQNADEAVVDAKRFGIDSIGSTLRLSADNDEDTLEMFTCDEYTIVGVGNSPTYMNYERGTTSLGNGSVAAFAYLTREGFDCDYFTEIYVRLDSDAQIYSDEYANQVDQYEDEMTDSGEERAYSRFESLLSDAEEELADGQSEYDDAYAEYQQKRDDAERELQDALQKLEDGEAEIAENEQKILDGKAELADARVQYEEGVAKLESNERKLRSAQKSAYSRLDNAQAQLEAQLAYVSQSMAQIEESGVLEQRETLEQSAVQLDELLKGLRGQLEQLESQGQKLRDDVAQAQAELDAATQQQQQEAPALVQQRDALIEEIGALEAELATLAPGDDERIAQLNSEIASLNEQCQALETQLESLRAQYAARIGEAEQALEKSEAQAQGDADAVAALEAERDSALAPLRADVSEKHGQIESLRSQIAALDPEADAQTIAQLQGQISALEADIANLEREISSVGGSYEQPLAALRATAQQSQTARQQAASALDKIRQEAQTQIGSCEAELDQAHADIAQKEAELATLTPSPDAQRRAEIQADLAQKRPQLEETKEQLAQYDQRVASAQTALKECEDSLAQYETTYEASKAALQEQILPLEAQREQVQQGLDTLESYDELSAYVPQIEAGLSEVAQQRASADAQFLAAWRELRSGRSQLADALIEIEQGEQKLEDGRVELADARVELEDGRAEYEDARAEADQEFADAEQELADAREELADAREKISEIEEPDVYVLDRTANVGYVCFESDSQIVQGIANVFPLFFFMVAALVCMTTMTRMVDEQRTQIGVLKALGYGQGAIMGKFVFYSGSAAFLGSVIGFIGGSMLFPKVIWKAYDIMYGFSDLELVFDWGMGAAALAAALVCSVGTTWACVRRELAVAPANLLRPSAPKAGKRILFERIRPLWRRLSFMRKLTVRNIFRYKKRLVMMVIGIGGCTALLVTGLGIRDSISEVVNYQFEEITRYDIAVNLTRELTPQEQAAFVQEAGAAVESCLFVHESSVDVSAGDATKSVYLVCTDAQDVTPYVDLHRDGEAVALPGEGEAVLSLGLAETLGVEVGDQIVVRDSDLNQMRLQVSGLFENYIYNYVYVRPQSCAEAWGYQPEVKSVYVRVRQDEDPRVVAASLAALEDVGNVSVNLDMRERVNSMMESLDYIVMLVVFSAGALAFVVLYNLTNINITERTREIATIKVLGFYPRETASYVFSENLLLCVIAALVGLPMGKALHAFVMAQIRIDMMRFDVRVLPLSYLIAVALTFVFAFLVNFALRFKLEKINMAESLKTVE